MKPVKTYNIFSFIVLLSVGASISMVSYAQNQRYFTGDNTNASAFNKIAKSAQRSTRDLTSIPASFSLKQYAPVPGFQGNEGTCVAWSVSYAARTISYCIQHNITDSDKIKSIIFSPSYLYYYVKTVGDNDCTMGAEIESALKTLRDTGDVLQSASTADCIIKVDSSTFHTGKSYIIKAYSSLSNTFGIITKNEVLAIKKSIAEKKPVIFSIKCLSSFFNVGKDGIWKINPGDEIVGNHAICIVGYDDNKYGGAFEVMNSWGTSWGNNGFFWLTYDQMMQYGSYALELMDREVYTANVTRQLGEPKLNGSIDFVLTNDFGNDISTMPVLLNTDATLPLYQLTENYEGGTKFKIKFNTNAPAFVYIFSVDDSKIVSTLFPYADNISPVVNSSDAIIYLPSEEKHYTLHAGANRDQICVLYSKEPVDFNNLKDKILQSPDAFYTTISSLYKDRLIPLKNINLKKDAIDFSANAAEDQLICFFIDMNHK